MNHVTSLSVPHTLGSILFRMTILLLEVHLCPFILLITSFSPGASLMVKTIAVLLDKYAWNAWLILVVLVKTLSRWCFTCTASELLHLVPLSPHFGKSVYVYPKWKHTVTFSVLNSRIVYFDVSTFRLISAQAPSNGIFSCKLTYLPVIFVFFGVPFLWKRFDRYRQTMFQAITRVSLKCRPVSVSS